MKNSPTPEKTTSPENVPAVRIPINKVASTNDVASLNKLSPSTKTVNRSGTPSCLKIEITATGSVALNIAPRSKATIKSKGEKMAIMKPIMAVEISKPGTAKVKIGTMLRMTWRAFKLKADSNIRVGIKTNRTRSGESANVAREPNPGTWSAA